MRSSALLFALLLASCGDEITVQGHDELVSQVAGGRIGRSTDQWIEIKNMAGEWERTGLIFGYVNDREECQKAIAGLKKENYATEYRCVSAN